MAAPAKQETWAIVDDKYLLALDDAIELLRLISKAQPVTNT